MIDWFLNIDGWTWAKVACLMAFALAGGLLKRRMFEQEMREQELENARHRFRDPFDD